MRIPSFSKFLEKGELERLQLRDATVVVDAYNFFFDTYKDSGLLHTFGCEADRFADYLREYLSMFKKANVKCYFVFKGGHENMEKRLQKAYGDRVSPIFFKSVYREVLDEMKFNYVTCEYESKKEIIALAQKLQCYVISQDIEFCFSGLQYIPKSELKFNQESNAIDCRCFTFASFYEKYNLDKEKMALFIVLTDEFIFPRGYFSKLFSLLRMPTNVLDRNTKLLKWLSETDSDKVLVSILKSIPAIDASTFNEEKSKVEQFIQRSESCGLATKSLIDKEVARVGLADPLWFLKGIIARHVAVDYINLYRSRVFFGSDVLPPTTVQDDAILLSLHIVKYAYDLLTNFQNDGFTFHYNTDSKTLQSFVVDKSYSIPKPNYNADVCVFENGWTELRQLRLLEHFLLETLQGVDLQKLDRLPVDVRLLVVALVYFSHKKAVDNDAEITCVLLSYVMLSVVFDKVDTENLPEPPFPSKPVSDSSTDKNTVSTADCKIAAAIIKDYYTVPERTAKDIFDQDLLHPIIEFQHVLSQLDALNSLCGAPWTSPMYSRTYNGTLVYRLRLAMRESRLNRIEFLDQLLSPAPTVYAFLNGLIEIYDEMM